MQKFINRILAIGLLITVASCATPSDPTKKPPGFLSDYSLLKQVPGPDDDTQVYVYKNPNISRSDYHTGIVESVSLYQTATESGVTNEDIEKARANIDAGIKQIVSKKIPLTDKPGPGVFRLQVSITGATLEKDSLKPWNILPVSAAITLASKATGLDSKKPVLVVELKLVDSQTGKLLKKTVTIISGDKFRMKSYTADAFSQLATAWVQMALKYSK